MPSTRVPTEPAAVPLLALERLEVRFATAAGVVTAVHDLTLSVARGECLGVVGESGAGKSQAFLAPLGLLAANGTASGSARFAGTELIGARPRALDGLRGAHIGVVFQDPLSSLTPHLSIGAQISEVARRHLKVTRAAAQRRARELLEQVELGDAARRLTQYPHELSGGMRQRALIAIALAAEPQLLILDEPTSALDVTVQAQILGLLAALKRERGLALVLITHDLGAVAGLAERLAVLKSGQLVESGSVAEVLGAPRSPYAASLLREARAAQQDAKAAEPAAARPAALSVSALTVRFPVRRGPWRRAGAMTAVSQVSLAIGAGGSLGVVGESGSGKSTLVRAVLQLVPAAAGRVVWMGQGLSELAPRALRALRRDLPLIFQDPAGSLDPRMTVSELIGEPLAVHRAALTGAERGAAIARALQRVHLPQELARRYPHQLSGGQCQRVGIARAMVLEPRLLVCDEPVSALDATTQEQIVTLLQELRRDAGVALLIVSHNLAVVRRLCDAVLVLYLGRMMELAPGPELQRRPRHPYTRELLAAVPLPDPQRQRARLTRVRAGEAPSPLDPPSGCVYRSRCPYAAPVCAERVPEWQELPGGAGIACHRWAELPEVADPDT